MAFRHSIPRCPVRFHHPGRATRRLPRRHALALAATGLLLTAQAQAQATPPGASDEPTSSAQATAAESGVARITITGRHAQQPATIAGFGDTPLSRLPLSATVITRAQLADAGIASLGDITRLDADITDAYNAPGYINQLAVRGFTLDNRFNVRRDGLPVNGETVIGQANKQALEVLKGTSGLQSGTSAPGGLLNLVVKRPSGRIRDASLGWTEAGTIDLAVDVGDRGGADGQVGWRVNAAGSRLDPQTVASRGDRHLVALAADLRAGSALLEVEIESSRQSQPSTPGFSLLGDRLPDASAIDPRINLNNQRWSLPVVFDGQTGSVRITYDIGSHTELGAHAMRQSLRTDDRVAFPYGCSAENRYDRYCTDGSFDLYDFRSEGERRTSDALAFTLATRAQLFGLDHRLHGGLLLVRQQARFNDQAFNWVGVGTVDGLTPVPADPSLTDTNTNRDERSTELHLQDQVALARNWTVWAGARHTRLQRSVARTDGSQATAYRQAFTTPWLALGYRLDDAGAQGSGAPPVAGGTLLYASAGQGVESEVTPNRSRYVNAGQALPALKSRQLELGIKHLGLNWDARAAIFDIRRPAWNDLLAAGGAVAQDGCSDTDPCIRRADGATRHRGIEADAEWRAGELSLRASAMWLQARREGSADSQTNGLRPTNVPARSLKAQAAWNLRQVPGLTLLAFVMHEGQRVVLPDNSIATPGWTRLDLGARWALKWKDQAWVLRIALDNATDSRAWQEAPYQYGHAYLYPLAPRTWRASAEVRF